MAAAEAALHQLPCDITGKSLGAEFVTEFLLSGTRLETKGTRNGGTPGCSPANDKLLPGDDLVCSTGFKWNVVPPVEAALLRPPAAGEHDGCGRL